MTTKLRPIAGRVAVAGLATLAVTGAAVAGAQAATPHDPTTNTCTATPVSRAFDFALSLRSGLDPEQTPSC